MLGSRSHAGCLEPPLSRGPGGGTRLDASLGAAGSGGGCFVPDRMLVAAWPPCPPVPPAWGSPSWRAPALCSESGAFGRCFGPCRGLGVPPSMGMGFTGGGAQGRGPGEARSPTGGSSIPQSRGGAAPRTEETEAGASSQHPSRTLPTDAGGGVSPEDGGGDGESRLPFPHEPAWAAGAPQGAAIRGTRVCHPSPPGALPPGPLFPVRDPGSGAAGAGAAGAYLPLQLH